jgi:1-acyl-sn-glycerol-3-phosphate acyltransferase
VRRGFWFRFAEAFIRPASLLMTRRDWRGHENIPASGAAILVVNHLSYADPIAVSHYIWDRPRELKFLVKAQLFEAPFVGFILRRVGQIPVYRESREAGKALQAAVTALREGTAVVVYPEGTCTKDPDLWPMEGKTGAARLWLETGAPVIPIVNWGAHRLHDPLTKKLHLRLRTPVIVSAGTPVDLSAFEGRPPTAEVLREVTEAIMRRLRSDLAAVRGEPEPTGPLYSAPRDRHGSSSSTEASS